MRSIDQRGLLVGTAGISLALLAAITGEEPGWDGWLRVSLPPRRESQRM